MSTNNTQQNAEEAQLMARLAELRGQNGRTTVPVTPNQVQPPLPGLPPLAATGQVNDGSGEMALEMNAKRKRENSKKATEEQIKKVFKDHLFRVLKFIQADNTMARAVDKVFVLLDYDVMKKMPPQDADQFKRDWKANYGACVPKMLNGHRGDVQQSIRRVCYEYTSGGKKPLPATANLESILKRELHHDQKDDVELMCWWWDVVIPKACGNTSDWSNDKRYFGTMSQHHWPDSTKKKYVTPHTEALAIWFIENNRAGWPAAWQDIRLAPPLRQRNP